MSQINRDFVLLMVAPPLVCLALLIPIFRSGGISGEGMTPASRISKAQLLVSVSAAAGLLMVALVSRLFVLNRLEPTTMASFAIFSSVLCVPRMFWFTRWRATATDLTAVISAAMVLPFISFWPLVLSLAGILGVAASLLRPASRLEM